MTSSTFRPKQCLTISDIHLGHPETPMAFMLANLTKFFNDFRLKENFNDLTVIFIAGDLWHKQLGFGTSPVPEFIIFWYRFCQWCIRKKIAVRLLKGTPSHDDNQGDSVNAYTTQACPELDFLYVNDIYIEHLAALGKDVLYVPDECRHNAELIYQDVQLALRDKGLTQVDIGIMHGMFEFQLGNIPSNAKVHTLERYEAIVRDWISIGHVHTASHCGKAYAQGSFDRTAHGEEGKKGAFLFSLSAPGVWDTVFLENKHAMQYVSYKAGKKDEETLHHAETVIQRLPDGHHFRIVARENHPLLNAVSVLTKKYPRIHITRKIEKVKPVKKPVKATHETVHLNEQTIRQAVLAEVHSRRPLSQKEHETLHQLLSTITV